MLTLKPALLVLEIASALILASVVLEIVLLLCFEDTYCYCGLERIILEKYEVTHFKDPVALKIGLVHQSICNALQTFLSA